MFGKIICKLFGHKYTRVYSKLCSYKTADSNLDDIYNSCLKSKEPSNYLCVRCGDKIASNKCNFCVVLKRYKGEINNE